LPKRVFSEADLPDFDRAPSVVAVVGQIEFFVEEAAAAVRARLAEGDVEVLRFNEEAPAATVAEALLNRSLFSPRRVVETDVSRFLGSETPASLLEQAVEAWARGSAAGRREAFRHARRLLSSLDVAPGGDPAETAEAIARKLRRKEAAPAFTEVLRDLPEEKDGASALTCALRLLLERGNDGLVALLTASAPPAGADLLAEIASKGLVLEIRVSDKREDLEPALARLARAKAKERDVAIDNEAIARLRVQTDLDPALFAAELEKLIEWAGEGGRIRAADVRQNVEDEASEDIYEFYEAVGRRDAGDALRKLERLFSGRDVRAGSRYLDTEDYWPVRFFGMFADEIRRMLLVRARLEERGGRLDAEMSYATFQARVAPVLEEPVAPFGKSPFGEKGAGYAAFQAARRSSRFTKKELARALSRAADVDVQLKSSAPALETLTAFVGDLIAGA